MPHRWGARRLSHQVSRTARFSQFESQKSISGGDQFHAIPSRRGRLPFHTMIAALLVLEIRLMRPAAVPG